MDILAKSQKAMYGRSSEKSKYVLGEESNQYTVLVLLLLMKLNGCKKVRHITDLLDITKKEAINILEKLGIGTIME